MKEQTKQKIHKIISSIRAALEVYIAIKRKDPIYVGMSLLSTYNALEDIYSNDQSEFDKMNELGCKIIMRRMEQMIFSVLLDMGLPYSKWKVNGEAIDTILEFNLDDFKVYFQKSGDAVFFMYASSEQKFIEVFSKLIKEKLGNNISIDISTEGLTSAVRIKEIDIPLNSYKSTIDINGHYEIIQKFREKKFNRSSLLFGPPGCGKTTYAAKMADLLNGRLVVLNAGALNSMVSYGTNIRKILQALSPTVILFDDIDRLDQFGLGKMLGVIEDINRYKNGEIVLMGSVNSLTALPQAMRRPGRFDEIIIFNKPTDEQREAIVKAYMNELGMRLANSYVETIVKETEGMTPAYIKEVVLQADVRPFNQIPDVIKHMRVMMDVGEDEVSQTAEPPLIVKMLGP